MFKRLGEQPAPTLALLGALLAAIAAWQTDLLPPRANDVFNAVSNDGPNEASKDEMTKGYYEGLQDIDREPEGHSGLAAAVSNWFGSAEPLPADWRAAKEPMENRPTSSFLFRENIANYDGIYKQVHVHMNKWGQREREDYPKDKPPRTFRIAICGGSNTMGFGVPWEQTFGERLEKRLNEEHAGQRYEKFEVINFASNGYHLLEKTYVATVKCPEFHPDLILVDLLETDVGTFNYEQLGLRVMQNRELHFDFLKDIVAQSGVKLTDSQTRLRQRLKPFRKEIVAGCFRELRKLEQATGIKVVIVALRTDTRGRSVELEWRAQAAEQHGLTVLRAYDALEGGGPEMYVHPRDFHLSGKAHVKVGDEIYAKILADGKLRPMITDSTGAAATRPTQPGS